MHDVLRNATYIQPILHSQCQFICGLSKDERQLYNTIRQGNNRTDLDGRVVVNFQTGGPSVTITDIVCIFHIPGMH